MKSNIYTVQLEDLEETLTESIQDSIRGRKRAAEGENAEKKRTAARKEKAREEEEEYGEREHPDVFFHTDIMRHSERRKRSGGKFNPVSY